MDENIKFCPICGNSIEEQKKIQKKVAERYLDGEKKSKELETSKKRLSKDDLIRIENSDSSKKTTTDDKELILSKKNIFTGK